MRAWLSAHAESFALTFRHFLRQPVAMALSIVVMGIGLVFLVAGYLLVANVKSLAGGVSTDPQIEVFLAKDSDATVRVDIEKRLRGDTRIRRVVLVPREKALEDLVSRTGNPDLLAGLSGNPLPDAFVVTTVDASETAQGRVAESIRAWPGVESVDVDAAWSRRLRLLIRVGDAVVLGAGILLGVAMLAICFNTIRLQVLTRAGEIVVMEIFGATRAQIRRPFLYLGLLQGLLAGLFAWGAAAGFVALLEPMLRELFQTFGASGSVTRLSPADGFSLVGFAGGVGALGAWLAGRGGIAERDSPSGTNQAD